MEKLRALYIVHATDSYGGAALSFCNMISCLREYIEPIVICHDEGPIAEMLRNQEIKCIIHPFRILGIKKKDFNYYLYFPRIFHFYLTNERKEAKRIARELRQYHIDIVHSNSSIFTFGRSIAKELECPHVWHIREFLDLDFGLKVMFGRQRLKNMINNSDAIIAISNSVAHHWGFDREKTFVYGDAVASVSQINYSSQKGNYILFCAAILSKAKGTEDCLEAYANSGLAKKNIKLKIFGRTNEEYLAKIQKLIERYGISKSVELQDFSPNIQEEFMYAKAFVMASRCEALGRVTIEAMFNGCPVIGRATGGTKDIIENGKTGFLFTTVDECAELMRNVIFEDNSRMIIQAQEYVMENFSEEKYCEKIYGVYRTALQQ